MIVQLPSTTVSLTGGNIIMLSSDDSAWKLVYLAIMDASKKWTMPVRNRKGALNRFIIEFEDRLIDYV